MPDLAIAHVSNIIGGGMGTVFRVLLPAQVERGDKVTFFVRQAADEDRAYFAERGVELRLIDGVGGLTRQLRHFDVVHLHSADLDLLVAGWLSRRPAVFMLHGLRAQTRSLATVSVRRLPTIGGVRRRLKRAGLSWLLRHGMARVTTVSEFLAAKAVESYGVSRGKITVVYSGIALERFHEPASRLLKNGASPSERDGYAREKDAGSAFAACANSSAIRTTEDVLSRRPVRSGGRGSVLQQPPRLAGRQPGDIGPVLGWVGRLVPVKRVDVLLRAAAALAADGSWPALRVIIVGDGELRGELETLSRSLGLAATVEFVGHVDHPEQYLGQMDLFVFPSRNEGLPLAVNEALAAGLPVVVLQDGGGVVEQIRLSGGGVVVPDEPALAETIAALLHDPERRRQLSERGQAYALREFGPPAWADRFDEVYRQVLSRAAIVP